MRIYPNTFNLNSPSTKKVSVPCKSDFGIGLKIVKEGQAQDPQYLSCYEGDNCLSADTQTIDGHKIWYLTSGDSGIKDYTVRYEQMPEFQLDNTQTATQSQWALAWGAISLSSCVGQKIYAKDFTLELDGIQFTSAQIGWKKRNWAYFIHDNAGITEYPGKFVIGVTEENTTSPNSVLSAIEIQDGKYNTVGNVIDSYLVKDNDFLVIYLQLPFAISAGTSATAKMTVGNHYTTDFKLQIDSKNLGYFEKR